MTPLPPATFPAAPLDATARFATGLVWATVAAVWIGGGFAFASGADATGLILVAGALLVAAVALGCRRLQPLAYGIATDGLTVERRAGPVRFAGPVGRSDVSGVGLRLFGSGGLYGYVGLFSATGTRGGRLRAYVTDRARIVLLTVGTADVAISPADPDAVLAAVAA